MNGIKVSQAVILTGYARYRRKLNPQIRQADNGHGGVPDRDYSWRGLQDALDWCAIARAATLPICFPPEVIR